MGWKIASVAAHLHSKARRLTLPFARFSILRLRKALLGGADH